MVSTSKVWWAITGASVAGYAAMLGLSQHFAYQAPPDQRPLLAFYGLMGVEFLLYLAAIAVARRTKSLFWPIIGAVLFRAVLLPSTPIQEVDIYRYLWDGASLAAGENPFRHPPSQVAPLVHAAQDPSLEPDADVLAAPNDTLRRLVALAHDNPGLRDALYRVHFPELTTVYPPISQAVFASAAATTPATSTLFQRVLVMKAWLVALDLATLALVIGLLRASKMNPALCVAYGWCPLLLKEIANSGHLDAIAVFFVTLACWLQCRVKWNSGAGASFAQYGLVSLSGLALGLGVGAKLFPVVLGPLFLLWTSARSWRAALLQAIVFATVSASSLAPMLLTERATVATPAPGALPTPPIPNEAGNEVEERSSETAASGLSVFLKQWEMNDFLFMILYENLRPTASLPPTRQAWFSIVPEAWRAPLIQPVANRFQLDVVRASFLVTRGVTAAVFLVIASWMWQNVARRSLARLVHAERSMDPAAAARTNADWLQAGFLTLAWFLLLCPTINPWYWTWTLPLLAFAKSPAWRLYSGMLVAYYLRFYFNYHFSGETVAGTRYVGVHFFDFVLIWAEHLPLFGALIWCVMREKMRDEFDG